MYFPLFLPLWGIRKGNKGNFMPKYAREVASGKFSVFKHCSLLYQEVLRNPALLFLLSERKCSLWYWHRNVLTVPVHLSEQLHSRAGCWCRYVVTGESENLQILPASLTLTCKQCRVYSEVPGCHPVWGRQRRFPYNLLGPPVFRQGDSIHNTCELWNQYSWFPLASGRNSANFGKLITIQ